MTVGALVAGRDGFGLFQDNVSFTMPLGQNGFQAGKLFTVTDASTALVFATQTGTYRMYRDGSLTYSLRLANASVNGADATSIFFAIPLSMVNVADMMSFSSTIYYTGAAGQGAALLSQPTAINYFTAYTSAGAAITDNAFSGGASCYFAAQLRYYAF